MVSKIMRLNNVFIIHAIFRDAKSNNASLVNVLLNQGRLLRRYIKELNGAEYVGCISCRRSGIEVLSVIMTCNQFT